jgi:hypothetical protein
LGQGSGFVLCLLPSEAPFPVLAFRLIAIVMGLAETVEVALAQLFLMNDGGDDFYKAGVAKRRGEIVGSPGNTGFLGPLFVTFHTLHTEYVHCIHDVSFERFF